MHRSLESARARRAGSYRRQDGVALIIALVLVLIMSLLGTFAIRNATQSERSVNGIRTAEIAREAAETALRFCEQIAIADGDGKDFTYGGTSYGGKILTSVLTSQADTTAAWRSADNWKDTVAISLPATYYQKFDGTVVDSKVPHLKTAPRCLVQRIQTTTTPQLTGYLITARGFADNASFNAATGKTSQGAESWLQSVLTRNE
ncbi:MAG: hypothetical protein EON54_04345 [Alcaligenaceae bacterium]|nr:MAG: hypothetical protein EON54_04345 [Alcaligenaceae bacterium]